MVKIAFYFCVLPIYCSCIAYLDRVESGSNPKIVNLTVNYTHNAKGECVTNVTAVNHVIIKKLTVYVSFRVPENRNDREYKQELVKTIVDMEKVTKGLQSNPLIKSYVGNLLKCMDFEFAFPLKPVSINDKIY